MFAKLQQASRLNDTGGFPYLRSHPLTTERMADMQARITQPASSADTQGANTAVVQVMEHAMIAARARVLSYSAVDDLRKWSADVTPTALERQGVAQQAGALYGATFAALKLRDFSHAQALWAQLTAVVAHDPAAARLARLLGCELWLAQGQPGRAVQILQDANAAPATSNDGHRAELLLWAQAAVAGSQAKPVQAVTQSLQTWVASHLRDALAWQALATAYAAQGRTLGAIRAQAEVDMAQMNYAAALTRFKAAQDWARNGGAGADHIEASIVDTRTREAALLVREQALER